jgi:hypothetical protein
MKEEEEYMIYERMYECHIVPWDYLTTACDHKHCDGDITSLMSCENLITVNLKFIFWEIKSIFTPKKKWKICVIQMSKALIICPKLRINLET